ncbi:CCA tRNA nucleotidyltransferase [Arthrobacter sp. A2-55]|uniref:CCA tRNA nucleotidyltransferase n=1 Tax=Arthrobacter sp. A2-55 TaxID=2897337 RepID=UPI0021CD9F73|nr:HD domain-containing protein [Arthrobacter sp. A2-55]MCU6480181.1 HD domain-containing protein [Arthrobacter sp. A2-55]
MPNPNTLPGLIDLTDEAHAVLDAISSVGGRALIVGGSVRDALLARASGQGAEFKDIDIEVRGTTLEALLEAMPGEAGLHGESFYVLNTKINGQDFDIALPRRESKSGPGHRGFQVTTDAEMSFEDSFARRDLTINSMGWDPASGQLIDPYNGMADLEAGVLRHTSPAFADDPLRVLRAVRFAGRLGFDLDPETAELCRSIKDSFPELPKSRLWGEFSGIALQAPHVSKALETLHATGWEEHFPTLAAVRAVPQDPKWHPEGSVEVHLGLAADSAAAIAVRDRLEPAERTVVVLAAMLHDLGKATNTVHEASGAITSHGHAQEGVEPVRDFLNAIGAPRTVVDKVLPIVAEHMCHAGTKGDPSPAAVRRLIRRLAGDNGRGPDIRQWARVVDADVTGRGAGNKEPFGHRWVAVAETIGWGSSPSKAILRGEHLKTLGMKPSRDMHFLIQGSLAAQDDGTFSDESGALAWVREHGAAAIAAGRTGWETKQSGHHIRQGVDPGAHGA